jgi:hypothetical protein
MLWFHETERLLPLERERLGGLAYHVTTFTSSGLEHIHFSPSMVRNTHLCPALSYNR